MAPTSSLGRSGTTTRRGAARSAPATAVAPRAGHDPLRGASIAVVLQDPTSRDEAAAALREAGARVVAFKSLPRALLDLLAGGFDGAVISAGWPGIDGAFACGVLRDRLGAGLALLLTGDERADEAALIRGFEAGADDCLLLPLAPEALRSKLRRTLREVRALPSAPRARPIDDPRPPCAFAGYALSRQIGAGSYGRVYEARRMRDGQRVAIKLLGAEVISDRALLGRFLREAAALVEVESPGVVRVHDVGHREGRFFLVMDLVHGRPANLLAGRDGRVAVDRVIRLGAEICEALAALHARGLVHRDVKPTNILVDAEGRATLVDFGLVKPFECDLEVSGATELVGTLPYLAPEVVQGRPQDIGSDLYSLGVTLWELLAGAPPITARSDVELLQAIAQGRRAGDLRTVRLDVSDQLSWVVGQLLEPDPALRLRDPAAAARALTACARVARAA